MAESIPDWAAKPFKDFIDFVQDLHHVVDLSIRGIGILHSMPRLFEILIEGEEERPGDAESLKRARGEAELAAREIKENFPTLHGQAVVTLWSAVESLSRSVLGTCQHG